MHIVFSRRREGQANYAQSISFVATQVWLLPIVVVVYAGPSNEDHGTVVGMKPWLVVVAHLAFGDGDGTCVSSCRLEFTHGFSWARANSARISF